MLNKKIEPVLGLIVIVSLAVIGAAAVYILINLSNFKYSPTSVSDTTQKTNSPKSVASVYESNGMIRDEIYGVSFRYPTDWKFQKYNNDVSVRAQIYELIPNQRKNCQIVPPVGGENKCFDSIIFEYRKTIGLITIEEYLNRELTEQDKVIKLGNKILFQFTRKTGLFDSYSQQNYVQIGHGYYAIRGLNLKEDQLNILDDIVKSLQFLDKSLVSENQTLNWKIYKNDKFKFSFRHPSNWFLEEKNVNTIDLSSYPKGSVPSVATDEVYGVQVLEGYDSFRAGGFSEAGPLPLYVYDPENDAVVQKEISSGNIISVERPVGYTLSRLKVFSGHTPCYAGGCGGSYIIPLPNDIILRISLADLPNINLTELISSFAYSP